MDAVLKLNRWANAHTNIVFDALRILLGGFLFYKGLFLFSSPATHKILQSMPGLGSNLFLVNYIEIAEICAGLFIAMGLITRLSVVVVLPIVTGAVIANCLGNINVLELAQAIASFVLCMFFFFYGSGKHSVDYSMRLKM
jgi:uncharacterized membrane protein YphA (DoxX/SURF4 family)